VVVTVSNPNGKLLPGMTATIDFLTGSAKDVLLVPNAALRFRPTEEMRAAMRKKFETSRGGGAEGNPEMQAVAAAGGTRAAGSAGPRNPAAAGARPRNAVMLWYLDDKGEPAVTRVRTGLSDGQRTEVSGKNLKEGMQVIVGVTQTAASTTASSPFQPQAPAQPRRPGGF
jgi:HlyD family secretion protein